jgi:hypothetical protein
MTRPTRKGAMSAITEWEVLVTLADKLHGKEEPVVAVNRLRDYFGGQPVTTQLSRLRQRGLIEAGVTINGQRGNKLTAAGWRCFEGRAPENILLYPASSARTADERRHDA